MRKALAAIFKATFLNDHAHGRGVLLILRIGAKVNTPDSKSGDCGAVPQSAANRHKQQTIRTENLYVVGSIPTLSTLVINSIGRVKELFYVSRVYLRVWWNGRHHRLSVQLNEP